MFTLTFLQITGKKVKQELVKIRHESEKIEISQSKDPVYHHLGSWLPLAGRRACLAFARLPIKNFPKHPSVRSTSWWPGTRGWEQGRYARYANLKPWPSPPYLCKLLPSYSWWFLRFRHLLGILCAPEVRSDLVNWVQSSIVCAKSTPCAQLLGHIEHNGRQILIDQ